MNHVTRRRIIGIFFTIVFMGYPAAVYYGLTRHSVRVVATVLLSLFIFYAIARFVGAKRDRELLRRTGEMIGTVTVLLVLAAIFNDQRFILSLPVLINLVLLWGFAGSLRTPVPIVERFARLHVADLSAEEIVYCRRVTIVWSGFFVLNGSVAAGTALFAPFSYWALYNGLIAYILIGILSATEYILRKYLFRRFRNDLLDRLLKKILPPAINNR
jgi:uncharacterized membrane protein